MSADKPSQQIMSDHSTVSQTKSAGFKRALHESMVPMKTSETPSSDAMALPVLRGEPVHEPTLAVLDEVGACMRRRVCICVCTGALALAFVHLCLLACACLYVGVRTCVRACVRAGGRACMHACVRAYVCSCVCACMKRGVSARMCRDRSAAGHDHVPIGVRIRICIGRISVRVCK